MLKADAFALQWVKRFFAAGCSKWKNFFTFFASAALGCEPREALLTSFSRRWLSSLPEFYRIIFRVWQSLDGGLAGDELSIAASSASPLPVECLSSKNVYQISQNNLNSQPHCIGKFAPQYGPLHWPQTWSQLHLCTFDRLIVDLNWQIAHGVLYTGSWLGIRFNMTNIDPRCFCRADDQTLEPLFFGCELARLLVAWVHFNLWQICPPAAVFFGDRAFHRPLVRISSGRAAHHHLDAPGDETHHLGGTLRFPFLWAGASSIRVPEESHCQNEVCPLSLWA